MDVCVCMSVFAPTHVVSRPCFRKNCGARVKICAGIIPPTHTRFLLSQLPYRGLTCGAASPRCLPIEGCRRSRLPYQKIVRAVLQELRFVNRSSVGKPFQRHQEIFVLPACLYSGILSAGASTSCCQGQSPTAKMYDAQNGTLKSFVHFLQTFCRQYNNRAHLSAHRAPHQSPSASTSRKRTLVNVF